MELPSGSRAKAPTPDSISPVARTSTGLNSTPNDGATDWIAPHIPMPDAIAGSRRTATRDKRGAISLSTSSNFPPMLYSNTVKPVVLPPGRARLATKPPDWIGDRHEHDRNRAGYLLQRRYAWGAHAQDDVGCKRDQFRRAFADAIGVGSAPAILDAHVAAVGPAQLLQSLQERGDPGHRLRIVRGERHQHADAPHFIRLLRARSERPRG